PAAPPLDPCPRHKSNAAKYVCTKCQTRACDDCVKNFSATENKKRFCPVCSGKCVTLDEWKKTEGEKLARESMTFRARLPGVFKYPFSKGGALLLIVGTILYLFLDFAAMFSWKLAILAGGYLFAYMQKIVCASAFGEEHLPDWPEFGEWWEDIARPFFMLVWTFVVSFGPAFGYMIYNVASDSEMMLAVLFPLFALGFLYFPMALLAVAMSNSFLAVNPLVVLPAITRLNLEYVAATAVFFGLVLARYLCETLLHRFVPVPILPTLVSGFLALYFLSAEMRLLGLMYYANRERLGWYRN
ncbi:MAG: hypothetical protein HY300_02525, partial [Verrucomicrobia bacterium]|nr:hypothetical protein [Verrucomicrobiota bacterium]